MDKEKTLRKLREEIEEVRKKYGVEFAEVVRCKDCKHWKKGNFQAGNDLEHMEYGGSCPVVRFARYESEFCNCGERRDNE